MYVNHSLHSRRGLRQPRWHRNNIGGALLVAGHAVREDEWRCLRTLGGISPPPAIPQQACAMLLRSSGRLAPSGIVISEFDRSGRFGVEAAEHAVGMIAMPPSVSLTVACHDMVQSEAGRR
jgi:hypothetical protein